MNAIMPIQTAADRLRQGDLAIVDCRFVLGEPDAGRTAYEAEHLPGAVYFDLERDLSGGAGEYGGRHPLPDLGVFAIKLGRAGIDEQTPVAVYDDQGGAMASRFWWMLRFLGHRDVHVLEYGFAKWKAEGYPITGEIPNPSAKTYTPQVQTGMHLIMEDVRKRLHQPGTVLVDSREGKRYRGEAEPIDKLAGHIPGARNHFWKESLREDGGWKSAEEQQDRFAALSPDDEVIVYCGSGVTACPNVLALEQAGYRNVKLYLGSWSDWISYPENPIATGEE